MFCLPERLRCVDKTTQSILSLPAITIVDHQSDTQSRVDPPYSLVAVRRVLPFVSYQMARLTKAESDRRAAAEKKRKQRAAKKSCGIFDTRLEVDGYFLTTLQVALKAHNHLMLDDQMDMGEYIELLIANTEVAPEAPDYTTIDGTKVTLDCKMHEKARELLDHKYYAPADMLELYILRNCGLVDAFDDEGTGKKQLYFQHPCWNVKVKTPLYHSVEHYVNPITLIADGPVHDKYAVRFAIRDSAMKKVTYMHPQVQYDLDCYAALRKANPKKPPTYQQKFMLAMQKSECTETFAGRQQTW